MDSMGFLWDPRGFFWDLKTWDCKKVPNLKKNPSRIPKKSLRISFQSLPTFVVEEQKDEFYGIRRDPWGFFGILWGIGVVMRYKNLRNLFETSRKGIFFISSSSFSAFLWRFNFQCRMSLEGQLKSVNFLVDFMKKVWMNWQPIKEQDDKIEPKTFEISLDWLGSFDLNCWYCRACFNLAFCT